MNGRRSLLLLCLVACSAASTGVFADEFSVLDHTRVANEGAIASEWRVADGVQIAAPAFPAEFADAGAPNSCIALGYRINPDGTTSDFRVLNQWNEATGKDEPRRGFNAAISTAARAAVAQWKFAPRNESGTAAAVDTVATMSFNANRGMDADRLRETCAIPDLVAFYADQYANDNLVSQRLERRQYMENRAVRRAVAETPAMRQSRLGLNGSTPRPMPASAPATKVTR